MGIRIKRAMGWGMTIADFEQFCLLTPDEDEGEGKLAVMQWLLSSVTDLVVPKEADPHHMMLVQDLLRKSFDDNATERSATCLVQTTYVFEPEEHTSHVIFYPNSMYAREWYRSDDGMDYMFARWANGSSTDTVPDMNADIRFVPYNPYPYTNNLMHKDGTPVRWDGPSPLERNPDLVAEVPTEIRWWTKHVGIFNDDGVNVLRPIIAQWWS